jgi:cytochrome P450
MWGKPKFDMSAQAVHRDPYPVYRELRRKHPIYYDAATNYWMVSRYEDVCSLLKNNDDFSSQLAGFEPTLLGGDPPVHTRARRAVLPILSASRVNTWEDPIRLLARAEVDRVIANGRAEMMREFFEPLQVSIISWVFGLDRASFGDIHRWSAAFVASGRLDLDGEGYRQSAQQMDQCKLFMRELLTTRQRERNNWPISLLFEQGEHQLSMEELIDIGLIFLVGGYETTPKLIANALILLSREPAMLDALREDAALIPPFLEEVLRYDSPIQRVFRVAKRATTVAGVTIPQGARIILLIGSANRDSTEFDDADQFRLDRTPNNHITFGLGPHFCLGARLALLESRIVLEELLQRLSCVTLASPQENIEYVPSLAVRGPCRLELLFPSPSH